MLTTEKLCRILDALEGLTTQEIDTVFDKVHEEIEAKKRREVFTHGQALGAAALVANWLDLPMTEKKDEPKQTKLGI